MSNNIGIDSTWVRDRFNLQYNNIFSNQAPGLVDYEISMYLTMAHIEIIDEYSASVDLFEKNRSLLTAYLVDDKITGSIATTKDRGIDYQTFEFSENYWKIMKEYAITNSNALGIPIKPITYDGFNTMSVNPFKKPNGLKGWRLDINSDGDAARDVKILFEKIGDTDYIREYDVVYLVTPKSFDLESDIIPNSLDNNPFLTEKIINRSVELATRDYRDNTLQSQVQINKRSE
jgi:hypothetical protein